MADLDRDDKQGAPRPAEGGAAASILALDNIRLDLPLAGVGSRCLAGLIDGCGVAVLLLLWVLLCSVLAMAVSGAWAMAAGVAGVFLIEWGYFAGMEIATGGRTLGKMAVRLRVVTAEGAEAGAGALLVRNLVRDFDYLVGVPLMALDPLARRLGDRLAGTLVVHEQRQRAVLLGRVPPGWSARDVAIVESFLARAEELRDEAERDEMARLLLARVERDAPELVDGLAWRRAEAPVGALRRALAAEQG
ncbi:MAG: RDD family protein [Acidobacteria bacterium]|nr:RDD family protein [Acidobacteriota bacterium]